MLFLTIEQQWMSWFILCFLQTRCPSDEKPSGYHWRVRCLSETTENCVQYKVSFIRLRPTAFCVKWDRCVQDWIKWVNGRGVRRHNGVMLVSLFVNQLLCCDGLKSALNIDARRTCYLLLHLLQREENVRLHPAAVHDTSEAHAARAGGQESQIHSQSRFSCKDSERNIKASEKERFFHWHDSSNFGMRKVFVAIHSSWLAFCFVCFCLERWRGKMGETDSFQIIFVICERLIELTRRKSHRKRYLRNSIKIMQETAPAAFNNRQHLNNNSLKPSQSSSLLPPIENHLRSSLPSSKSMDNLAGNFFRLAANRRELFHRGLSTSSSGTFSDSENTANTSRDSASFMISSFDSGYEGRFYCQCNLFCSLQ